MILAEPDLVCLNSCKTCSEIENREMRLQHRMAYMIKWTLLVEQKKTVRELQVATVYTLGNISITV